MFMVVIFSLSTYKTDICVPKQLLVYTQECAVYKISWGGWAGGILSTLKIKQKGFCPKKGFCLSWKIYRRDSVHLVKMSGRDYIHVAKNMGGIVSTYTKMSRRLCLGGILSYTPFFLPSVQQQSTSAHCTDQRHTAMCKLDRIVSHDL